MRVRFLTFAFFVGGVAIVLAGCSRQIQQDTSSAVDAATGLGAAKIKLEKVDPTVATAQCQQWCRNALAAGRDLSAGPCLSDEIPAGIRDWACDVAHSPRQAADNLPENQCAAFRNGTAKHFVEVDENCNVIKIY